ncbi:flagellin [Sporomusaceae bacterium FL31]|nr:flagellin [Sporomusaceae bacterium FL31]GCE33852.1 flagellin [Sporomusaceae bacterium]
MSINANINLSPGILPANRNNAAVQADPGSVPETGTSYQQVKKPDTLNKKDMTQLTAEMTKFMQLINSDIQFQLHEETKQLIVQVIDTRDGKVLKEFPPHELLDTMAKIKEYVGVLLDKKV